MKQNWIIAIVRSRRGGGTRPAWRGVLPTRRLRTFDLLLVPEPAQVGGGLAALSDAGQGDVVPLQGRIQQAVDLRLLWHS